MFKPALLLLFFPIISFSQTDSIYYPRNFLKSVSKEVRAMNGKPGKNFWQNTADYNLKIKVDPQTRLLTGSEDVVYYNNSPDTLKKIVIRLYPDFFKKGNNRDVKIEAADENDGVKIYKMIIGDKDYNAGNSNKVEVSGTNMTVRIAPLAPKSNLKVSIDWSYEINKGSHSRTGMIDDSSGFIGYCFPRIVVYDDVEGWDNNEYLGKDESYFDNGNFNADVTVPENYVVWATGIMLNEKEIFTEKVFANLQKAKQSDELIFIIDSTDAENKNVTAKNKWNTFKFKATDVPDFAFGFSNYYLWQASSIKLKNDLSRERILVGSAFNKVHKDFFDVALTARQAIEIMSYDFPGYPYPYPHMTVVDGLDQMEYPMLCNDNPVETFKDQVELTTHEIMHTYFPFMMATNQTKYGWMDEGWATIGEWIQSPLIYGDSLVDEYGIGDVNYFSGKEADVSIIVNSTQISEERSQFINNYAKPAFVLYYLRDMLGKEKFRALTKQYMDTWKGKHHTPWDFFNFFSSATNQNLNWLWKRWYFDWGFPDLALTNVERKKNKTEITIEAKGIRPVPVNLNIEYTDGSKEKIHYDFSIWKEKNILKIKIANAKTVKSIKLGDLYDVDVNKKDNSWTAK